MDREVRLEGDIAELSERAQASERWAEESAEAAELAERRAVEAEGRVRELEAQLVGRAPARTGRGASERQRTRG